MGDEKLLYALREPLRPPSSILTPSSTNQHDPFSGHPPGTDATVRHFAERSLAVSDAAGMVEYVAVAKANFVWLAWRQRDFDEVLRLGREAIELLRPLPLAGPNWWSVCVPVMDTLLQRERTMEAIPLAELLIQPHQHRLNDAIQTSLQQAVQLWNEDRRDEARLSLQPACELAKGSLFL